MKGRYAEYAAMNKFVKIVGGSLAVLAVGAGIVAGAAVFISEQKRERIVDVQVSPIDLASTDLQRGEYLFVTRACTECHGKDGGGHTMIDDQDAGLFISAPNITRGGRATASYSDADWLRLLRHGVKPSGRPAFIMPSEDYAQMADEDVAALVSYIRSLPPAAEYNAEFRLPLIMKGLYAFGVIKDAAEKIDHTRPAPRRVPDDVHEKGEYVANVCTGCHGRGLAGGRIPGAPPTWPAAANLTSAPDAEMARYSSVDAFRQMMRTGKRADGTPVAVMPFENFKAMNDTELDALFAFLKTLPPKASGSR
jgi:mono/diheme cytochrome c family protein